MNDVTIPQSAVQVPTNGAAGKPTSAKSKAKPAKAKPVKAAAKKAPAKAPAKKAPAKKSAAKSKAPFPGAKNVKKAPAKKAAKKAVKAPAKKAATKKAVKKGAGPGFNTNPTLKGMSRPGTLGEFIKKELLAGTKVETITNRAIKKFPDAVSIDAYIRVCRKQLKDNGKRV